jgi:hypothetical protein
MVDFEVWGQKIKTQNHLGYALSFNFSDRNVQTLMICFVTNLRSAEVFIAPRLGFEVSY